MVRAPAKPPIYASFGRYGPCSTRRNRFRRQARLCAAPQGHHNGHRYPRAGLNRLQLPRLVGQTDDGQDNKANIWSFWSLRAGGKTFVSIEPLDPHGITSREPWRPTRKKPKDAAKHINGFASGIKGSKRSIWPLWYRRQRTPGHNQRRRLPPLYNRAAERNYSPPHRLKGPV